MNKVPIISCNNLSKRFQDGALNVDVLKQINLKLYEGEKIAIIGPSGSGKSTLLQLLAGLDTKCHGEVYINGQDLNQLSDKKRCKIRNQTLGFIYQFHHLLPEFSALENVMLPSIIAGNSVVSAKQQARLLLENVSLQERLTHRPAQLSGGERQRVAIARSMINRPQFLLADEPTGNLDSFTASLVFDSLLNLDSENKVGLLLVTHDLSLAKKMDKVLRLERGQLFDNVDF